MISPDDPRLTAYALGELRGEDLREVEAALAESAELRQVVEDIRASLELLNAEAVQESAPRLTWDRRQAIEERLSAPVSAPHPANTWGWRARVAAIVLFALCSGWLVWSSRKLDDVRTRRATAEALIGRIHRALERYQAETGSLPPDTGYGFSPIDPADGAGRTYDSGSLWRYLANPIRIGDKTYGPYLTFTSTELVPYKDPVHGDSFYVVDPWGTPIGYIGDRRRVIHNIGRFDIFSAGPDRKTAQDVQPSSSAANLAYDGIDNDNDGIADNASEMGSAALNGCFTLANTSGTVAGLELDDLNNWDQVVLAREDGRDERHELYEQ
jgi:hypothetical protein